VSGQPIDLLTELSIGAHTFVVTATDGVGNASYTNVALMIVVTAASVKDDVAKFLGRGEIKNRGLANSLLVKLSAAADARATGDCVTARNVYNAFIAELQAQSSHGVNANAASVMIADAQYLITHCP
jgi:hypothetical protein